MGWGFRWSAGLELRVKNLGFRVLVSVFRLGHTSGSELRGQRIVARIIEIRTVKIIVVVIITNSNNSHSSRTRNSNSDTDIIY